MADEPTVTYQAQDKVSTITLNRPRALNAINRSMKTEFLEAFDRAEADPEVSVVVLRGAGRSFCAGVDLKQAATDPWDHSVAGWRWHLTGCLAMCLRMWTLTKPVIAAVRGHALGSGCDLALSADLTIAASDATFGEPEIRGTSGPPGLMMPWVVGLKRAKELLLFGDSVDAAEAERLGIANRVFPADSFDAEVDRYAARLSRIPATALALNKRTINKTFEMMGLRNALDFNTEVMISTNMSKPPEQRAARQKQIAEGGLKAMLEKRDDGLV
jgi:enoyl-CoA hydratase/carnithine racemase